MTDQYAVIGHPIKHSKSPLIHTAFAKQCDELLEYTILETAVDDFEKTVTQFISNGGKGLNVTLPFKQDAWKMADELSEYAKISGAVNTLTFRQDGTIHGDNTDGPGLVYDLTENQQTSLKGKRILLLGAGGAVRGVIRPLLDQETSHIHIANRTASKAEDLAQLFAEYGELSAGGYDGLAGQGAFDVIINGTASSLSGELPPLPISILDDNCHAYDMMYGAEPTVFERWCTENGAGSACGGLGMLVEQAAVSFNIWRSKKPDTAPVLSALMKSL